MFEACEHDLTNCLRELHQIFDFGALEDKDELIRFSDQKVVTFRDVKVMMT